MYFLNSYYVTYWHTFLQNPNQQKSQHPKNTDRYPFHYINCTYFISLTKVHDKKHTLSLKTFFFHNLFLMSLMYFSLGKDISRFPGNYNEWIILGILLHKRFVIGGCFVFVAECPLAGCSGTKIYHIIVTTDTKLLFFRSSSVTNHN